MAIFSQADSKTATDFRNYTKKGNRTVPYKLPTEIEEKLMSLMSLNDLIDICHFSQHDYKSIFSQLESLGCCFLQLRFLEPFKIEEIREILAFTRKFRFKNIDLFIWSFDDNGDKVELETLLYMFANVAV